MPNVKEAAEVLAKGAMPVPVRLTVGAAPELLLLKVRVPVRLPRAVGANVTLTEQVAPAPRVLPQLLLWLKSPVMVKLVIVSAVPPVFDKLTLCDGLEVPTRCAA